MSFSLTIKGSALKEIQRLPADDRSRVVTAIEGLRDHPHQGVLLKGAHTGLRRIRVGCYRVIFEVEQAVLTILVLRVGHRRDVYR